MHGLLRGLYIDNSELHDKCSSLTSNNNSNSNDTSSGIVSGDGVCFGGGANSIQFNSIIYSHNTVQYAYNICTIYNTMYT